MFNISHQIERAVQNLKKDILPMMPMICEADEDLGKIVPLLTAGKQYKAGVYTVGKDFP